MGLSRSLIRQCANLLIVGAVAFSTYAILQSTVWISWQFGADWKFGYRRLKTSMQEKEEKKVKSFTGLNRTCLESC